MTSLDIDGVGLTLILCNGSVNTVHDIRADWGLEDGGKRKRRAGWPRLARGEDVDLRTGRLHQKLLAPTFSCKQKEKSFIDPSIIPFNSSCPERACIGEGGC